MATSRRRERRTRRALRRAGALLAALALVGGYAAADAADAVPGVLTTAPLPVAPELPEAPGALADPAPAPALPVLDPAAPAPDPAVLAATVGPLLDAPALRGSAGATVLDVATGQVLLDRAGTEAAVPASVAKVLTAAAVLARLGPDATLATRAVAGPAPGQVVLVGGGDLFLAAGAGDPTATAGRAGLGDLAEATAASLRAAGTTTATVLVDDTLTGGAPATGPRWTPTDLTSGFAAPLTSLAVDGGRLVPGRYSPRTADPALAAASAFADALVARGIAVPVAPVRTGPGSGTPDGAPAGAAVLGEVRSAPLVEVVEHVLAESDNTGAEGLARLVGADAGRPPGIEASAAAVLETLAGLGLDVSGATLVDASGLGQGSQLTPALLAQVLAAAAAGDLPRSLLAALPVGGLTGTLADRFAVGGATGAGAGLVRAKTGSLNGVTSLAGTVVDADGRLLAFALLADGVGTADPARAALDAVAVALAGCGCR